MKKTKQNKLKLFTDEEYECILEAACGPAKGANLKQVMSFVRRCERVAIDMAVLNMVLKGKLEVAKYLKHDVKYGLTKSFQTV